MRSFKPVIDWEDNDVRGKTIGRMDGWKDGRTGRERMIVLMAGICPGGWEQVLENKNQYTYIDVTWIPLVLFSRRV